MKETDNLTGFLDLLNIAASSLPDKVSETVELEGIRGHLEKDKNYIKLELEATLPEEGFDEEEIKEIISEYKDNIKALDDDLFIEVIEELKSKLDLKKFNELLDLESFNKEQAREVEEMINISSDIICLHLQHKIQDMVELYEQF